MFDSVVRIYLLLLPNFWQLEYKDVVNENLENTFYAPEFDYHSQIVGFYFILFYFICSLSIFAPCVS